MTPSPTPLSDANPVETPSGKDLVETPSGKDEGYENFPVGSFLLPAALRPHIATFYHFARAADDIADNPALSPDDKIQRLDGFEAALKGENDSAAYAKASAMRRSLDNSGVTPQHCIDLLAAFKQDAVKPRYDDWDDLMAYCALSAAPVGRYLIDLHGGSTNGYRPSDALCAALQVINHLQDARDDLIEMDRVYIPEPWLVEAGGTVDVLKDRRCSLPVRAVFDRCLGGVDALLVEARALPGGVRSFRLGLESGAIIRIAEALSKKLRAQDPLAGRVGLTKPGYLICCLIGAAKAALGR
ncbi:MAG: squalene synthase HpnC [Magnetovibrionaceae bacterium]